MMPCASSLDEALFFFFYRKQFAEDKQTMDMDYWNHVLWFDETKINLFGSDGVKCVWQQPGKTSVSCLQSSMVVGVSWSWAVWVLPVLGIYSKSTIHWGNHECQHVLCHTEAEHDPSPLRKLRWRAVFQHDNLKHTSKTTAAFLKKLRVNVMDWPTCPQT